MVEFVCCSKKGQKCFRERRDGERKRKSVRGCIVGPDMSVISLVVVKKGEGELPGITDKYLPRRSGPRRASRIRKLFNLTKEDDVTKYVVKKVIKYKTKDGKEHEKVKIPKVQRLVTPERRRKWAHKRAAKFAQKAKSKAQAEAYAEMLWNRQQAQRAKRQSVIATLRGSQKGSEHRVSQKGSEARGSQKGEAAAKVKSVFERRREEAARRTARAEARKKRATGGKVAKPTKAAGKKPAAGAKPAKPAAAEKPAAKKPAAKRPAGKPAKAAPAKRPAPAKPASKPAAPGKVAAKAPAKAAAKAPAKAAAKKPAAKK